ncbi:TetR/AcrR family transcriptional regulator [Dellaglioa sp. BT-FLS60]
MADSVNQEQIVQASWELLAEDGINTFSMRKLAKKVDLSVSTLYWHFENKNAIFNELINEVAGSAGKRFKKNGTWQERLLQDGIILAQELRKRPYSAELMLSLPPDTDNYWLVTEQLLVVIDDLKLSDGEKFNAISILLNYILAFERDFLVQKINVTQMPIGKLAINKQIGSQITILKRLYQKGLFQQMGTEAALTWSLQTIIVGLDQQQNN